ncbi:MAG: metallophosphoesterase, partial [Rhodococcus sp. (in: high G+C Gram-positive bacteria)]
MARTGPTEVDDVASAPRRLSRRILVTSTVVLVVVLLFGVPLWTVFFAGSEWPTALQIAGCVLVGGAAFALPAAMAAGHARGSDRAARIGDTLLGAVWVLFVWSALGALLGLILGLVGFD